VKRLSAFAVEDVAEVSTSGILDLRKLWGFLGHFWGRLCSNSDMVWHKKAKSAGACMSIFTTVL
jgi:hypothetical protein